jgi:hypothetical protein
MERVRTVGSQLNLIEYRQESKKGQCHLNCPFLLSIFLGIQKISMIRVKKVKKIGGINCIHTIRNILN